MDKINRALLGLEDNSARIEAVLSLLKRSTNVVVLSGTTVSASASYTSFGTVSSSGGAAVIAVFDGNSCELKFANKSVATRSSPILGVLPCGVGELKLAGVRNNARVLIIGASAN